LLDFLHLKILDKLYYKYGPGTSIHFAFLTNFQLKIMTNSSKVLFSPIKVGKHDLKHRVVHAPLTRVRCSLNGTPSELMIEYYKQRSTDGGLLIAEATNISRLASGYKHSPGIYTKEHIEAWKKITDVVHEKNATIFLQLWHIGRAGASSLNPNCEQTVSASDVAIQKGKHVFTGKPYEKPRALEIGEIKSIVQDYRQAALNAMEAGFDGVELHAANGYLPDQFINSSSNKRTDIYGGSIPNRARFSLEILDSLVEAVGTDRVGVRFSPGNDFQDMYDDTPVETWSYLTTEIQRKYPDLGYLHFIEPRADFFDENLINTDDSLQPYRAIWKGPFIVASGFSTARQHAIDISEKTGNLVAFGRAFIANPDLVERLRNDWELNEYDRSTFYSATDHGPAGYTDYPFYNESK
jgi:2,4-dienoyl-CoA reductase-like NADH-dependent reductase (Old Yellow Enzyme family)